jgi:hypothetical protein
MPTYADVTCFSAHHAGRKIKSWFQNCHAADLSANAKARTTNLHVGLKTQPSPFVIECWNSSCSFATRRAAAQGIIKDKPEELLIRP